uniref:Uncharacterized protein n=1 Tax=Ixodes ricinus TaxID=34613 RepID=A0A6B0UM70_IXORI
MKLFRKYVFMLCIYYILIVGAEKKKKSEPKITFFALCTGRNTAKTILIHAATHRWCYTCSVLLNQLFSFLCIHLKEAFAFSFYIVAFLSSSVNQMGFLVYLSLHNKNVCFAILRTLKE